MVSRLGRRGWQILVLIAALAASAAAREEGIATLSMGPNACRDCHNGGTVPVVQLSGPDIVLPLSTHTYTLTVSNPSLQTHAGLNVSASAGTFAVGGSASANTQVLSGEIAHSSPKAGVSGVTTFTFNWTAPASFTSITMSAWGNAVNFNGASSGDRSDNTTLSIANENIVGTATPTDTPTPTPPATLTPTPTATATEPPPLCDTTPRTCQPPAASSLTIVDNADDAKDSLAFKWSKGPTTVIADFGDPIDDDDYALCVYVDGVLQSSLEAPAGGLCANNKDCWVPKSKGFAYKDKLATPSGLTAISLAVGKEAGKAKIQVKAKGSNLPEPVGVDLGAASVTVQLVHRANSICWGDSWSGLEIDNDGVKLKAKSTN